MWSDEYQVLIGGSRTMSSCETDTGPPSQRTKPFRVLRARRLFDTSHRPPDRKVDGRKQSGIFTYIQCRKSSPFGKENGMKLFRGGRIMRCSITVVLQTPRSRPDNSQLPTMPELDRDRQGTRVRNDTSVQTSIFHSSLLLDLRNRAAWWYQHESSRSPPDI
ncbi:hypothetical protein BDW71DRAFT_182626 [Aspergillus fruticulosus]